MIELHRHSFTVILLIVALLLLATIAMPRALGQEPQAAAPPSLGDHCRPDFWIVSSRDCLQRSGRCGTCCSFEYARRTPDGCLCPATSCEFQESLVPGVPVCIVVHGSFVQTEHVFSESDAIYAWIRGAAAELPLHVVFYTWPSDGAFSPFSDGNLVSVVPTLDVAILGRRGGFNGHYLAQLIGEFPPEHPISIFAHSHGARTTCAALHLLGGGDVQGMPLQSRGDNGNRIRAVLAAAAIDHNWLNPGSRYGQALCRAECVLNLRNRRDLPLAFYPFRKPFSRTSLARTGFTAGDLEQMGCHSRQVAEFDVSALVRSGHMMPNYYQRPEIAAAVVEWLYYMAPTNLASAE